MENTTDITMLAPKTENSNDAVVATRYKFLQIIERLNFKEGRLLHFILRNFYYRSNGSYNHSNGGHRISPGQKQMALVILDKTIKEVVHEVDIVTTIGGPMLKSGEAIKSMEIDAKKIIRNLTDVPTLSKVPRADIVRRMNLLNSFKSTGKDALDLQIGSELRMYDDFLKLTPVERDEVMNKLSEKLSTV